MSDRSNARPVSPRARRAAARTRDRLDEARRGAGKTGRIRERDVAVGRRDRGTSVRSSRSRPIRRTIAARMVESHRTTAPVTLTTTADATNLVNLRGAVQGRRRERRRRRTPTSSSSWRPSRSRKHPLLAARWTDDGIAPADERSTSASPWTPTPGLLVPVVRDVPALEPPRNSPARSRDLIERARGGRLARRATCRAACFTVTNLGAFGIDAFTADHQPARVRHPRRRPDRQAARLWSATRSSPRDQVTLSLTFDHRIVDGAPAARFLQTLAQAVENPAPWVGDAEGTTDEDAT